MISISSFITVVIIIFAIRFLSVFYTLKTNIEVIFRPGNSVVSVYGWSKILFAFVAIAALLYFIKTLRKTDSNVKSSYFFLFLFYYLISAFSNRFVYKNFSYLYVLQAFNIKFTDIIPLIEQDLFYEEPYIFWFILIMLGVFGFFKIKNKHEYAILFWIIPFCFLQFPTNSVFVLYGISILVIAIFGMKYADKFSSLYYHLFQFIILFIIILYSFFCSICNDRVTIKYSLEILSLYFIPSLILIIYNVKKGKKEAVSSTWILPAVSYLLVAMPLHKCFFNNVLSIASSIVNSFLWLGNVPIVVSFIFLFSYIAGKINIKLKNISFYLLSGIAITYYIVDSLLFHYSHFRINQQTLAWTMAMDDIVGTTLKTCLDYVNYKTWLMIVLAIVLIVLLLKNSNSIFKKHTGYRFFCLTIILTAQISIVLLPIISKAQLNELQDPFFAMVRGIEWLDDTQSLSEAELKAGFAECKVPLKEYVNKEQIQGNGYNIILVTLESVHWRYLDIFCDEEKKTWPEMSKYKDRMEIFPFFFSCYPESTTGDVSVVSGLQPYSPNYILKKDVLSCPTIANDLKKANYDCYLFSSESLIDGKLISMVKTMPFNSVLSYSSSMIKNPDDYWYWGIKEEKNVDNIIETLSKRDNKNPYFVWYRTVYPHAPFTVFEKPQDRVFKSDNILIQNVVLDYKNCLIYLDKQLAKLIDNVDKLDKQNNKQTIVFFIADHGEMLGEKDNFNLFGHGLYAQSNLTNCPCIIVYPKAKGLKINRKVGSQIDAYPTFLDCLGLESSVKRFEFGESLIRNEDNNRPVYLSSAKSYALVEDGYYYYFKDKNLSECIVEKISIDENNKATFERIEYNNEEMILEKYNRIKKYFKLQTVFINSLNY